LILFIICCPTLCRFSAASSCFCPQLLQNDLQLLLYELQYMLTSAPSICSSRTCSWSCTIRSCSYMTCSCVCPIGSFLSLYTNCACVNYSALVV
jgi:hypothetical protein